jgi:hypothetical protein
MNMAAQQVAALCRGAEVGSSLRVDSASSICPVLERLVPSLLRGKHSEWQSESLDGFYFARAVRTGLRSVELAGTCTLISDQRMTPFRFELELSVEETISRFRIRLGEPGVGPVGIAGPAWGSSAAAKLLSTLERRLDRVPWKFDEVCGGR